MHLKFKVFSILFSCLIFIASVAFSYNYQKAIDYANNWVFDSNGTPIYNVYDSDKKEGYKVYLNDCANYVSQCLIAGGQILSNCYFTDDKGCITDCDSLHDYLLNNLHAEYSSIENSGTIPDNLTAGDIVIFGDSDDNWTHAAIVVSGVGNSILLNTHTTHRKEAPFSGFFPLYPKANFYHFKNRIEAGVPVEFHGTYSYMGTGGLDVIIYESGFNYLGFILLNNDKNNQDMVIGDDTSDKSGCTYRIKGWCTNAHKGIPETDDSFGSPWTSSSVNHWAYWLRKTIVYGTQNSYSDYEIQHAVWYITDRSGDYDDTDILSAIGYSENGPIKNTSSSNSNDVIVYPNPWKHNDNSGYITFKNLTTDTKIDIFSLSGELVRSLENTYGDDLVEWNLDNLQGQKVASGVYIYLITNSSGAKSKGKLAIVR